MTLRPRKQTDVYSFFTNNLSSDLRRWAPRAGRWTRAERRLRR